MAVGVNQDGKKWIQTSVALVCMLLGYVLISFFEQINDWWQLESFVPRYFLVSQILSVLLAFGTFVYLIKNTITSTFLSDVYVETLKVIWPNKNETVKHTIVIMILVSIIGFILGFFDYISSWALSLIS